MPETTDLNGACARDREFARHVARVWAFDLSWEDFKYFLPDWDALAPIPAPRGTAPFCRHFRETADDQRRNVAIDWVQHGHSYYKPFSRML